MQNRWMIPWFIATEPFTPMDGSTLDKYIEWRGLSQLAEVVSLGNLLCRRVLTETNAE